MAGIGNLVANLSVDSAPWKKGLKGASSSLGSFVSGIAGPLAIAGTAVAGLWGGAKSVSAYKIQVDAQKKLQAVLTATGGAAGLSAGEIQTFASELQSVTNFGDEATIAAAGVLATFKEIKGDVFKDAIKSAQDMTAVMGGDLQGKITQIGRALNDPAKGMAALADSGVSFSEQQKEQIKLLQQSGDIAGAQSVILNELQGEFGGAAMAMADPMTQFGNIVGDVSEMFGSLLLPSINAVASVMSSIVGGGVSTFGDSFEQAGLTIAEYVIPALEGMREIGLAVWEPLSSGASSAFAVIQSAADSVFNFLSDNFMSIKAIYVGYYSTLVAASGAAWGMLSEIATTAFDLLKSAGSAAFSLLESTGIASLLGIGGEGSITFKGIAENAVTAMAVAEWAFKNWRDVAKLSIKGIMLGAIVLVEELIHHWTVRVPTAVAWFADNFKDVMFTAFDYASTIAINLGENIREMWTATKEFISGNGFNPNFTDLAKGARSAIDSLPNIPERIKSDFEKALREDISTLQNSMSSSMGDLISERLSEFNKQPGPSNPEPDPKPDPTPVPDAVFDDSFVGLSQSSKDIASMAGGLLGGFGGLSAIAETAKAATKLAPKIPPIPNPDQNQTKFAGAFERGSQEAFSLLVRAQQGGDKKPELGLLKSVVKAVDGVTKAVKAQKSPEAKVQGAV